jgi:hypothetical protein
MAFFSNELLHHRRIRPVECYLCRRGWEEQWVGCRLTCGDKPLGSLCPLCVEQGPRRTAQRLRGERDSSSPGFSYISGDAGELQSDLVPRIAQVRMQTLLLCRSAHQLLERGRELCRMSAARLEQFRAGANSSRQLEPAAVAQVEPPNSRIASLQQRTLRALDGSPDWPVGLATIIAAERVAFVYRFAFLGHHYVRRAVDERYERFLKAA